jgi:hypothetical protein
MDALVRILVEITSGCETQPPGSLEEPTLIVEFKLDTVRAIAQPNRPLLLAELAFLHNAQTGVLFHHCAEAVCPGKESYERQFVQHVVACLSRYGMLSSL